MIEWALLKMVCVDVDEVLVHHGALLAAALPFLM